MCLAGKVGSVSMPLRVCVCWYLCVFKRRSSRRGPGAARMPEEWYLFPLRGPNEGFRCRAPTMRPGLGHKGHKNTPPVTQCKSSGGGGSVCMLRFPPKCQTEHDWDHMRHVFRVSCHNVRG